MEWTEALEYCNDRIDGLERSNRLLAQTLAQVNAENVATRSRLVDVATDVEAYKVFVGSVHTNMEQVVSHKLSELTSKADALTSALSSLPSIDAIELRIRNIELLIQ